MPTLDFLTRLGFEQCTALEVALVANRESFKFRGYVVNMKERRCEETSSCHEMFDEPVGPLANAPDIAIGQERSLLANDSSHVLDGTLLV